VTNFGLRGWCSLTLTAASVAVFALVSSPDRADAQDFGFWFRYGSGYPRRSIKARRRPLLKAARQSDDDVNAEPSHQRGERRGIDDKNKAPNTPVGPLFASSRSPNSALLSTTVADLSPSRLCLIAFLATAHRRAYSASSAGKGGTVPTYTAAHQCRSCNAGPDQEHTREAKAEPEKQTRKH
jgi:hypothetical protein